MLISKDGDKQEYSKMRMPVTPFRSIRIDRMPITSHVMDAIRSVFHIRTHVLPERYRVLYDEIVELSIVYLIAGATGIRMVVGLSHLPTKDDFIEKWYLFAMRYNDWHLTGHVDDESMASDLDRIEEYVEDYLRILSEYHLDIDRYFGSGYEIIDVVYRRYAIDISIIGDYRVYLYHAQL